MINMREGALLLGRRRFLYGLAASAIFPIVTNAAEDEATNYRIVTFDWGLTATALMLGANVVGLPSIEYYNLTTVEPPLPPGVVDVGLLFTPNFEFLDELAPNAIIIPPALGYASPMLERIAPTSMIDINGRDEDILRAAQIGTNELAAKLDLPSAATTLWQVCQEALNRASDQIAAWHGHTVCIASFADERHLRAFGKGSLFDQVARRLSLRNALDGRAMLNGRTVIGMEELAAIPDAAVLLLSDGGNESVPANSAAGIFWRSLPAVRRGRVFELPAVLEDGGLPAAIRFAHVVSDVLAQRAPNGG